MYIYIYASNTPQNKEPRDNRPPMKKTYRRLQNSSLPTLMSFPISNTGKLFGIGVGNA